MQHDAIILVTSSNGQSEITKKCLDSIVSKFKIKIFLLNYGVGDKEIQKLGNKVDYFEEFPDGTPITVEMNRGIQLAIPKTKIVFNLNNDTVMHKKTIDFMIEVLKTTDIKSLCGHITTSLDELHDFDIKEKGDLYYKDNFVSQNKFKSWLEVLNVDFGFDLYSANAWHTDYFKQIGLVDSKNFNEGIYLWDTDYQYRGVLRGIETYVASSAVYYHACSHTANSSPESRARMDKLYTSMKLVYQRKWGGKLTGSQYVGTQHNEDFIFPNQDKLTQLELLEFIAERIKK